MVFIQSLKLVGYVISGFVLIVLVSVASFSLNLENNNKEEKNMNEQKIILLEPIKESEFSIEEVIEKRRSVRDFKDEEISKKEISQLLWAAQGITEEETGFRTAPSAGGIYPLKTYLIVRKVEGLDSGVYRYVSREHSLIKIKDKKITSELANAALGQKFIEIASVNIVIAADYKRTTDRYGDRGKRYVYMEAGHAAQNIYLQCESLNLGTVVVGAFDDKKVKEILELPEEENPLYIIPIGKKK